MKTGNKQQAMILCVVAVLAVGFLIWQILPGKKSLATARAADASTSSGGQLVALDLPRYVIGSPFSHSRLAPEDDGSGAEVPIGALTGVLPFAIPGDVQIRRNGVAPEENAGETRQQERTPSQLTLSAIMRLDKPVAIFSSDIDSGSPYEVGDVLANNVRLIRIADGAVVLQMGKGIKTLHVGEDVKL